MKKAQAYLCAIIAGGLVALAFPPFHLSFLGFLVLLPLTLALHGQPRKTRLGLGWVAGLSYQLPMFAWMPATLEAMSGLPYAAGLGLWLLYALSHGLLVGLWALGLPFIRTLLTPAWGWVVPLGSAGLFAMVEWAFPMLFPWSLGHFAWEMGPLYTPLLAFQGVPWLTLMVLFPGALLAELWLQRLQAKALALKALALWLALWGGSAGLYAALAGPAERTLNVAVVQPNYTLEEKKRATLQVRANLFKRLEKQLLALPSGLDLVMGSEGAYPLWWRLDAASPSAERTTDRQRASLNATRRLQQITAEHLKAPLALGGLRTDEDGEARNSVVLIDERGQLAGHYDKQTLLPFGEYIPLAETFPILKKVPGIGHMVPGDRPCQFETNAGLIACGICYETVFAGQTRRDLGEAEILLNMTIDTWFGEGLAPWLHLMTHTSRAAELRVPLLRASLTGISAIVDAQGQVRHHTELNTEASLVEEVILYSGTTLYRLVGQVAMPALVLLLAGLWLRQRLSPQRSP